MACAVAYEKKSSLEILVYSTPLQSTTSIYKSESISSCRNTSTTSIYKRGSWSKHH